MNGTNTTEDATYTGRMVEMSVKVTETRSMLACFYSAGKSRSNPVQTLNAITPHYHTDGREATLNTSLDEI